MNKLKFTKILALVTTAIVFSACNNSGSSIPNADNSKAGTSNTTGDGGDTIASTSLKLDDISTHGLDMLRINDGRLEIMPDSSNDTNVWLLPQSDTITALSADVRHGYGFQYDYMHDPKIALLLELTTTTGSHYFAVGANSTICPVGYCDSHGYEIAATLAISYGSQSVAYYLGRIQQTNTAGYEFEEQEFLPPSCYYYTADGMSVAMYVLFADIRYSQRETNIQQLEQLLNQLATSSSPISFTYVRYDSYYNTTYIELSQQVESAVISNLESESYVEEANPVEYNSCSFHEGIYVPDRKREKLVPYTGDNLNAVTIVTDLDVSHVDYTFSIALDRENKRVLVQKNNLQGYFDISNNAVFGNLEPSGNVSARFFIKHYSAINSDNSKPKPSYIDNVHINNVAFDDFSASEFDTSKWKAGKFSYSEK